MAGNGTELEEEPEHNLSYAARQQIAPIAELENLKLDWRETLDEVAMIAIVGCTSHRWIVVDTFRKFNGVSKILSQVSEWSTKQMYDAYCRSVYGGLHDHWLHSWYNRLAENVPLTLDGSRRPLPNDRACHN